MTGTLIGAGAGVALSVANSLVFLSLAAIALKKKTTTAAAMTVASFLARLTVLFFLFLYVVNHPVWSAYTYPLVGGFIVSHLVLLVLEIWILLRLEAMYGLKEGVA